MTSLNKSIFLLSFFLCFSSFSSEGKPKLCQNTKSYEKKFGPLFEQKIINMHQQKMKTWDRHYYIKGKVEDVYSTYISSHLARVWNEDVVGFQFAYAKGSQEKITAHDPWPGMHIGMRFFVDIKIKGVKKICHPMVGVVVNRMVKNKIIRYSYLKGSMNMGYNDMIFTQIHDANGEPVTEVHHVSRFKASTKIYGVALKFAYEQNHSIIMNDMHERMKILSESNH